MQEEQIIGLLLNREESGMDALVRHYGPLIRYVIAPILEDPRDREDCFSEVTMQIWERIGQFDGQRGSWKAWLTTIARNTALNHRRNSARHRQAEALTENEVSLEPTPEDRYIQQEQRIKLQFALKSLNPKEQMLFYRKYYYMHTTAQIASELGMTERAVEGKLYRIKQKLRQMLGGEGDV